MMYPHAHAFVPRMTLTWPVAAAVLFAAFLHAGWNAMVKSGRDKGLDIAALHLIGAPLGLAILAFTGLPAPASWPWLAASAAIHVAYYLLLVAAYRHGDLALTYPLMRGAAPPLVALASLAAFGEALTPAGWAGVAAVSAGVLALGWSRQGLEAPRAIAFALATAVVIAGYTLVDGHGARASGGAAAYVAALFVLNALPFTALVVARRGWQPSWTYIRGRLAVATLGAAASLAAYGIALWAMTRAPVATVAALRETSVLFALLIGSWGLREAITLRRLCGAAIIVAGVVGLRLG